MPVIRVMFVLGLLIGLAGCRTDMSAPTASSHPLTQATLVPHDVHRIAVLYPQSTNVEWTQAYHRLEGETFSLKVHRPELMIIDRVNLPILLGEHRLQLTGAVADDSAIHIGRLLGVDSVLIYRIEGPSLRDRLWARRASDLPPVSVTSKLIRVESAEVLYHRVIIAPIEKLSAWTESMAESQDYQRLSRDALDRGIMQTVVELGRAFD
jgi:hypothetical protein